MTSAPAFRSSSTMKASYTVPPAAGTSVSIRTTLQIESGVNGASLTLSAIVSWSTVCASVDDTLVGAGQAGENGIRLLK